MADEKSAKIWQNLSKAIHAVDELIDAMPPDEYFRSEFYNEYGYPGRFKDSIKETVEYVDSEVERKMKNE